MNNMPLITDTSGKFYAGMTLEHVYNPNKKTYERFVKIDKNKDKFLSADEIIEDRQKVSKTFKLFGVGSLLAAVVSSTKIGAGIANVTTALLSPFSGGGADSYFDDNKSARKFFPIFFGVISALFAYQAIKSDKETNSMKKNLENFNTQM